jgi:hypothetical protein
VIAIECCIDVANHVIASENYRFPQGQCRQLHRAREAADAGASRRSRLTTASAARIGSGTRTREQARTQRTA